MQSAVLIIAKAKQKEKFCVIVVTNEIETRKFFRIG